MGVYLTSSKGLHKISKLITLAGDEDTEVIDVFTLTGAVHVKKLEMVIESVTTLTNMTNCHFNINDGAADFPITKTTTCTMSSAIVGSILLKNDVASAVAYLKDGVTGGVVETAVPNLHYEFDIIQKSGETTTLQFVYTTTDDPIAATARVYVDYESIGGGALA